MGCGESKLDSVATGNLTKMFRRKSSKKTPPKDAVEDPTVHQPNPTAEKESGIVGRNEFHANDVVNSNENDVASTVVAVRDVKDDEKVETGEENNDQEIPGESSVGESTDPTVVEESVGSVDPTVEESAGSSDPTVVEELSTDPTVEEAKPDDVDQVAENEEADQNDVTGTEEEVVVVDDSDQSKPEQEDQPEAEKSDIVEENTEKEELEVSIPAEEVSTTVPSPEEKQEIESPTKELETA